MPIKTEQNRVSSLCEKRGAGTSLHLFLLADVENKPFLLFNGALKERLDAIM